MVPTAMNTGPLPASEPQYRSRRAGRDYPARPARVLFLNTRDQCGADVAVHLSLMRAFDPERVAAYLLSNSQAQDRPAMERACGEIAGLNCRFAPLGLPSDRMARMGNAAKIAAMAPVAKSLAGALTLVRREKIDIIHATDRPRDAFFSTLIAKIAGRPNVVHMHSNCGEHLSRATLWGFRHASAVFGVSEFTRSELIALGLPAAKVHVAHNATDAELFDPESFRSLAPAARREWGIPDNARVIGVVGRLIPWKGQRELIEALSQLLPENPDLVLMIIGDGEDKENLRRLARERGVERQVVFTGWQDDIRPILASLDIFSLPSYEEPFGLAITEAMAMARPVIACASGGVPEIIEHGENGWLVPPRSADALADAIKLLFASPDLRRRLGANARRTVVQRFSPRAQANRVADLYTQIAGLSPAPQTEK